MKKTAIVTGAGRGIGYAISRKLGRDGFQVVLVATGPQEKYQNKLDILTDEGTVWKYIQADISETEDRIKIIEDTVAAFGAIHVLVNNAGVSPKVRTDLLDMTEESFDRVIGINTRGNMFLTQLAAKQMLKQPVEGRKRGTIINISSCSADVSSVNRGEYCVSKAGVSMLTTLYADRLAGDAIIVNEIRPGIIATDMTQSVKEKYNALIREGLFPIQRWGYPEDVADAVSVLAGDVFTYTTGDHINIDGGFHIKRL